MTPRYGNHSVGIVGNAPAAGMGGVVNGFVPTVGQPQQQAAQAQIVQAQYEQVPMQQVPMQQVPVQVPMQQVPVQVPMQQPVQQLPVQVPMQQPMQPQQIQHPPQYKITPSYKNNEMTIPKKSQFNIPASVRSFTTTERNSVIVGIEVNNIDKLDLNQPIAIIGEEIIQEELSSPEARPQEKTGLYSGMEQKLEELIGLIKTEKVNGLDEKIDHEKPSPQPKDDSVIKTEPDIPANPQKTILHRATLSRPAIRAAGVLPSR